MASEDGLSVWNLKAERFTFAAGSTAVGFTVIAGQNAAIFKLLSGGTFEIVTDTTQAPGSGYPLGANEILTLDARATIWAQASGATVVVAVLRGKSANVS